MRRRTGAGRERSVEDRDDRSFVDLSCLSVVRTSDDESLVRNLALGEEMTEGTGVGETGSGGLAVRVVVRAECGVVERTTDEDVERGTTERDRPVAKGEENRESCETATVNDQGDSSLRRWRLSHESASGSRTMPRYRALSQS